MSNTNTNPPLPPPPTLQESHSGIPQNLLHKAFKAKSLIEATKTPQAHPSQPRTLALPPGLSRHAFDKALAALRATLGESNVELADEPLKDGWYMEHSNVHDMMSVLDESAFVASAVAYPGSTAEVQKVILWANEFGVPLWPISMGRNLGYGGAAPRVRGSVVVDLGRRMNEVLDINAEDYTCLVEPGVSFYALHEEVKRRGLGEKMWIDTPDMGGRSVIGNTLDRGVGYTPLGDHWSNMSGLEVVLPTGEVVRTGMGALSGSNTWQTFPYGFGPLMDGLFSQSNMGIVTKMGMALMPNPGGYESFMYTFPHPNDLEPLIEIIRPLRISNILENVAQVRSATQTIAVKGLPRSTYYTGPGPLPQHIIAEEIAKQPCGPCTWIYYGMSYGPPHIRKYKLDIIHAEFSKIEGARKIDPATIPRDNYFWSRDRIASGQPDIEELLWTNWVPNGAHIAFSPVSPIRGKDARALLDLARKRHEEHGIDLFPAFCVGLREMHLIVEIVFDKHSPSSRKAALACMRAMVDDAAKLGYGEYRTALPLMDQVARTYDWNDGALLKLQERVKDALDPRGILAPGKSGVWPARNRGRGREMLGGGEERVEGEGVARSGESRL